MMKMFNSKKNVFDKINSCLMKKSHELIMSIYLCNYNGNDIYIRFDFVRKISAYKISWVDLKFLDNKKIDFYISSQIVTKFLATKLIDVLDKIEEPNKAYLNDSIKGDRVEIITYIKDKPYEFVFDRFLPLEWKALVDPIVIIFSNLPRSMECFLNEIFGKLDGRENIYNALKPIKFNLFDDDLKDLFDEKTIIHSRKLFDIGAVSFLEKVEDKYVAVVNDYKTSVVEFIRVDDEFVLFTCNCGKNILCEHICTALIALRNNKFNNFYKVKYVGRGISLFEKVIDGSYYLCYGVDEDKLLIISNDGNILKVPIIDKGKVVFEVLEDDDDCSLSKIINDYKNK